MSGVVVEAKAAPNLSTDFTDVLYIVVDDEGEPVSDYHSDSDYAVEARDNDHPGCRVFEVAYRIIDENPVVYHG